MTTNKTIANALSARNDIAVNFVNDATLRKFIADAKKCAAKAKGLKDEAEKLMQEYSKFFIDIDADSRYRQQVEDAYSELKLALRNLY